MDESVAVDAGYYAAGGMTSAADSVATVQGNGADVDDSNRHAAAAAAVAATGHLPRDPTAAVPAANSHPRGPTAAAVQLPRRGNRRDPSVDRHFFCRDFTENHQRQAHGGRAAAVPKAFAVSSTPSLCG